MKSSKKLGINNGQFSPMPKSPNAVSSQTTEPDKQVNPLPMIGNKLETKKKIIACLETLGKNSIKTSSQDYIHSVFVSALLRFKDDVELYIDDENELVHFRSASRVGYSDLGANRKRYQAFRKQYLK